MVVGTSGNTSKMKADGINLGNSVTTQEISRILILPARFFFLLPIFKREQRHTFFIGLKYQALLVK